MVGGGGRGGGVAVAVVPGGVAAAAAVAAIVAVVAVAWRRWRGGVVAWRSPYMILLYQLVQGTRNIARLCRMSSRAKSPKIG